MTIVITGGAGFIGANLARALQGHPAFTEVVIVDDLSTGYVENLEGLDVRFLEGSILDSALLDKAMQGATAVVHLAARPSVPRSVEDPIASHEANASGTVQVLEAARRAGSPHVIVASSSSVYGANPTLPKHEGLATMPMSPYAASKLATEAYALSYQAVYGLPVLCFRFFNVFGPLQPAGHAYAAVIPAFVSAALADEPVTVFGDGKQSRDFTYVGTVAAVITDAISRRVTHPEPVNLAYGTRQTLLEVLSVLRALLESDFDVIHTDPRPGDVRHSQAQQTRLQSLFPDIEPVQFEDGLRATVQWMRETEG